MEDNKLHQLWQVVLMAFSIAFVSGLAQSLQKDKKAPLRDILVSALYSGVLGMIIALGWYNYLGDNLSFLLAVSGLAGIGGANIIRLVKMFLLGEFHINISVEKPKDDDIDSSKKDST